MFLGCFCPYVGQPHSHIGWDKSMPFASINPTNPRTNPWNFHKKILRIGDFEKCTFFESAILIFFSRKFFFFFCFFLMKISQSLLVSKDGSKFWSSQKWQHFLTHAKHFEGECNVYVPDLKKGGSFSASHKRVFFFSFLQKNLQQMFKTVSSYAVF